MAPAASITDVCPYRAAHPALRVRLVKLTPAADARDTREAHTCGRRARHPADRTERNRECALEGEPCGECARRPADRTEREHAREPAGAAGRAINTAGPRRASTASTQPLRRTTTNVRTQELASSIAQRAKTRDVASTRSRPRAHRFERLTYVAGHTGRTAEEGRRQRRRSRRRRSRDCRSHAYRHACIFDTVRSQAML
jgi:hypothetical protein